MSAGCGIELRGEMLSGGMPWAVMRWAVMLGGVMPYLAIDTTSIIVSVAVGEPGAVRICRRIPQRTASERLLGSIRDCLEESAIEISELDGVLAAAGPGSFTGTRIGLATLQGFHQATGVRAMAISTLRALASSSPEPSGRVVLAIVDALRGGWYAERYRLIEDHLPESLGPPGVLSVAELAGLEFDCVAGSSSPGSPDVGSSRAFTRVFEPECLATSMLELPGKRGFVWRSETLATPLYLRRPNITVGKRRSTRGTDP